jgi:CubicO group peptidase (beta-lactamase class C family)
MLIERVSGIPYERLIKERLFDRLGMTDLGYDVPRDIIARRARGYALDGKQLRNADWFDPRLA